MLHIVNGDATVARLAPLALPGDTLIWRDILVEGPVAPDVAVDALAARRAPWLARRLGIEAQDYIASVRVQAHGLARALAHEELVLWFEHDLFCVVNLCHLAAWLERVQPRARVSLVFPREPLGTTESARLAELFAARAPFTGAQITRAAVWWRAYAASDPTASIDGNGPLMFLDTAWRLHLERFPSVRNGLGAIEMMALAGLDDTARAVADVFREAAGDERMRRHGLGDVQFAAYVRALADGGTPLVRLGDEGSDVTRMTVRITDEGRAVRAGTRDRLELQSIDWWIGGVHLEGRHARWRWDDASTRLVAGAR
jgi:hypothetical protein